MMAVLLPYLIGFGAGCATTLLLAALLTGTSIGLPLFLVSSLPIAIAAIGWGPIAGTAAVATVAVALLPVGSMEIAAAAVLLIAGPTAGIAEYLSRPWRPAGIEAVGWQPLGRGLLVGATVIALALIVVGLIIGFDANAISSEMAATLREWLAAPASGVTVTDAEIEAITRLNLTLLPYSTAALATAMLVFNLWLGRRIVALSGRATRPMTPLWTAELPAAAGIVFILALAASFAALPFAPAAAAVAGAFGIAEVLIGLAVLHALTRGLPARPAILAGIYLLLVLLRPTIAVVALLGVADGFMRFRARVKINP